MRRENAVLLVCLVVLTIPTTGWSKGETTKIEISGENVASPIEITEPGIVKRFHIWNGPGVRMNGQPYHMDPDRQYGAFIDWSKGMVAERPSGLQRLEVTFYVGNPQAPDNARKYVFAYEVDSSNGRGYIYLPRWKNDLINHGVEGNWFYASKPWDEIIIPFIVQRAALYSEPANRGMLSCTVGTGLITGDGTIELYLLDERGNRIATYRYQTTNEAYASVKEHIGDVVLGEETEVSCWPQRS